MSSSLSALAIRRILCFLESGDHPNNSYQTPALSRESHLRQVDAKWARIYRYFVAGSAPPLDHLGSLEYALLLKHDLGGGGQGPIQAWKAT